jgi:hypothetical protein
MLEKIIDIGGRVGVGLMTIGLGLAATYAYNTHRRFQDYKSLNKLAGRRE